MSYGHLSGAAERRSAGRANAVKPLTAAIPQDGDPEMGCPKGHRPVAGEESFVARPGLLAEGDKNGFALLDVITKLKI